MGLLEDGGKVVERVLSRLGFVKGITLADAFPGSISSHMNGTLLRSQREFMAAYLDWVYAAASRIAGDAATIDLRAYANRGGKKSRQLAQRMANRPEMVRELLKREGGKSVLEELDNHILLDLLDSPNPVLDGQRFQELTFLHILLAGEAFWAVLRNGLGKPQQLWPVMPYEMKEVVGDDKTIIGWVQRHNGSDIPWDAKDIIHIPLTNPNSLYRGMSIVQAAARAIDTDAHAADWNRNFFQNSAEPGFILESEKVLTDQVFARLKAQWEDKHRGTSNAHKIAVLEGGIKATKLTATQKEMDFLESRKFNRDQILAMFGVARVMLGIIESDGRSNMEAAEYNHAKRIIKPLMAREVSVINHRLAPEYDRKLVIGFMDPVPEDKEFALKAATERVNKITTVNEARASEGLDPIEGGDVLYIDANLVPIGTPPPATSADGPQAKGVGLKKKAFTTLTTSVRS